MDIHASFKQGPTDFFFLIFNFIYGHPYMPHAVSWIVVGPWCYNIMVPQQFWTRFWVQIFACNLEGIHTRGGLCLIALWPVQFRFSFRSELLMISSYRVNPHVTRF